MKTFSLGAVLSLTTGILLCEFNEMHKLAAYLIDDPGLTNGYGLLAVMEPCKEALLKQYPDLADIKVPKLDDDTYRAWVKEQGEKYGHELVVSQIKNAKELVRSILEGGTK